MNKLRIGLSLRTLENESYQEKRDAIAHDWYEFMEAFGDKCEWVLIPNLGEAAVPYIEKIGVNAIVLTGGNDIGLSAQRDKTELALLRFATENRVPVLGVCRGMQLIHHFFGGELITLQNRSHIAVEHEVEFRVDLLCSLTANTRYLVNSFHSKCIAESDVVPSFEVLATSDDGFVESFRHRTLPLAAVMWHPERKLSSPDLGCRLFWLLLTGEKYEGTYFSGR